MENINLEKLMQAQFDLAKRWLLLAAACGVAVVLINILVVLVNVSSTWLAFIAALLTVLNAVFAWRSDRLRDRAETTLRKFEMHKSLGWEISERELINLLATAPSSVKKAAYSDEEYNYFASKKSVGPEKLLENLEESAWWTKHQASRMANYVGAFGIAVFSLAFITLVISLQSALAQTTADNIAQITISIMVFMFSGGIIRLASDYGLLAQHAREIEEQAYELCQNPTISEVEAIKLLHDYQIARANSPLLPSWLWKRVSKELNELWNKRTGPE